MPAGRYVIAQISDIHCGDPRYDASLAEARIEQIKRAEPDVALVPGDLTASGYAEEYEQAAALLDRLPCPCFVVPGNHDERNVGWRIFQRLFGDRWQRHSLDFGLCTPQRECAKITIAACDSSEPDLDDGELGRVRHQWLRDTFTEAADEFRIAMLHHHLVAVPNTGRERNTVSDAGDVMLALSECKVDLVLSGHKHVPHVWHVDDMAIITSGTATTWRIRGEVPPSFNLITLTNESVELAVVEPDGEPHLRARLPRRP